MAYPHDLHAPTDLNEPLEVGWCDRCYRKFRLQDLLWQFDVRGNALVNLGIRVCAQDYDEPADILRPVIIMGPEGVVRDPRPPYYTQNFAGGTEPLASPLVLGPEVIPDDGP